LARCKIYEVQGPDPSKTAGAVRCHRPAVAKIAIDDKEFNICKKHGGKGWQHFRTGGWLYAVDLNAQPRKRRKK
jgi:hypothetical protein